jgi:hypothetical protein
MAKMMSMATKTSMSLDGILAIDVLSPFFGLSSLRAIKGIKGYWQSKARLGKEWTSQSRPASSQNDDYAKY